MTTPKNTLTPGQLVFWKRAGSYVSGTVVDVAGCGLGVLWFGSTIPAFNFCDAIVDLSEVDRARVAETECEAAESQARYQARLAARRPTKRPARNVRRDAEGHDIADRLDHIRSGREKRNFGC